MRHLQKIINYRIFKHLNEKAFLSHVYALNVECMYHIADINNKAGALPLVHREKTTYLRSLECKEEV